MDLSAVNDNRLIVFNGGIISDDDDDELPISSSLDTDAGSSVNTVDNLGADDISMITAFPSFRQPMRLLLSFPSSSTTTMTTATMTTTKSATVASAATGGLKKNAKREGGAERSSASSAAAVAAKKTLNALNRLPVFLSSWCGSLGGSSTAPKGYRSVSDSLDEFTTVEILEGDNAHGCEECRRRDRLRMAFERKRKAGCEL